MTEFDVGLILAAWLTGLAGGGGHCIGMCGGILGALGVGQGNGWRGLLLTTAAHVGRVTSYAIAGALVGAIGAGFVIGLFGDSGIAVLRVFAAALIFAIGLQLVFGRPLLLRLERQGARFWRLLAPQMHKLLPPRDPVRAFGVGALWGWLPCGLVYAELAVAAAAGGPVAGALVMAFFGLGTIVSLSVLAALMQAIGLGRMPRQASGALLLLFAVWTVLPLLERTPMAH
jgi:sulfite exporter TauE/SafE